MRTPRPPLPLCALLAGAAPFLVAVPVARAAPPGMAPVVLKELTVIQDEAEAALATGDGVLAEERARAALALDQTKHTLRARKVLVLALEAQHRLAEALEEVDRYLSYRDLYEAEQLLGNEIRSRLLARVAPSLPEGTPPTASGEPTVGEAPPAAGPPSPRRRAGLALAVGGSVSLGAGIAFLGVYGGAMGAIDDAAFPGSPDLVHAEVYRDRWGEYLPLGIALVAAGAALEIAGLVTGLAPDPRGSPGRRPGGGTTPAIVVGPGSTGRGLVLGAVGTF
ncbi:hypothetical protein L6R50_12615 [Myxococcota bacterium]|nr:hypothetical protein [Myxococcota bacterium]